ncbi:MAG: hypothetical protein HPY76_13740, partial [Anaerolineae bacterium]|nr:hypothetical protein [Anaerolineae bacterium]
KTEPLLPESVPDDTHPIEPSVWDYFTSWFKPRDRRIHLGDFDGTGELTNLPKEPPKIIAPQAPSLRASKPYPLPWRMLLALALGLIAQSLLEPPDQKPTTAIILYIACGLLTIWAVLRQEFRFEVLSPDAKEPPHIKIHLYPLISGMILMVVSFFAFSGNRFTTLNLFLGGMTLLAMLLAFRSGDVRLSAGEAWRRIREQLFKPKLNITITPWHLLLLGVAIVVVYFRFYQLDQVPGEMFSDHAEKLLDVADVLAGQRPIFFPRNTGREAIQMYLTAWIAQTFGTGLSFMSLKLGTALSGLLALPFIYLLGKEVGGKRVGLLAALLCGIAYWPNVISRVGLRFPLYPLFTAPVLYFLVRGLRTGQLRHFILSGIFLGLGLHGYSPMRIIPVVIVIVVGIYLLHAQARGKRLQTITAFVILAVVAFIVFLPLLRYMTEDPQMFAYRAFSRLGTTERDFPGNPILIFLDNLWKALTMFFWKNGEIWVHSIPGRPALDVVSAVLLFMGAVTAFIRYLRERHWLDITLLLLVPLLMLPSILSLSFPDENPSLNRTSAAIVPVFILCALALDAIYRTLIERASGRLGRWIASSFVLFLLAMSLMQNHTLVFDRFKNQFLAGAWNTSQIGLVIRSFANSSGTPESAFVVPYPHWVDTRLVGINAGYPLRDYALWSESFSDTKNLDGPKLFILKVDDQENLQRLLEMYPESNLYRYRSPWEGKDFYGLYTLR